MITERDFYSLASTQPGLRDAFFNAVAAFQNVIAHADDRGLLAKVQRARLNLAHARAMTELLALYCNVTGQARAASQVDSMQHIVFKAATDGRRLFQSFGTDDT